MTHCIKNTLFQASSGSHKAKLSRECFSPTLRENKKSSCVKKNKTLLTHSPTDKNIMTELIDYNNGMPLDKKEGQLVTMYIIYGG